MPAAEKAAQEDRQGDKFVAWIYFVKAYKTVMSRSERSLRSATGLSQAEFELLYVLHNAGGRVRFIDLANLTLLSQSRVSRQIDALQDKGLVLREATDRDRRSTFAILTPKGMSAVSEAEERFIEVAHKTFFDKIAPEHMQIFSQVLNGLMDDPDYVEKRFAVVEQYRRQNEAR